MPVVAPLARIGVARRQREEEAIRARARYNRHPRYRRNCYPRYRPPPDPPIFTMTLLFIPSVFYLLEVHIWLRLDQAHYRKKAQRRGITVEQFRNEELEEIEDYFNPYTRFFARRHLEKECQKLTLWQQTDKKIGGDRAIGK